MSISLGDLKSLTLQLDSGMYGDFDIKATAKGFKTELANLMKGYADLAKSDDPNSTLKIGTTIITKDHVGDASTTLLLDDYLNDLQQSMATIFGIYEKMTKMEEKFNA